MTVCAASASTSIALQRAHGRLRPSSVTEKLRVERWIRRTLEPFFQPMRRLSLDLGMPTSGRRRKAAMVNHLDEVIQVIQVLVHGVCSVQKMER